MKEESDSEGTKMSSILGNTLEKNLKTTNEVLPSTTTVEPLSASENLPSAATVSHDVFTSMDVTST